MKFTRGLFVSFILFVAAFSRPASAQQCLEQPISLTNLPAPPTWFHPPASSSLVFKQLLQDPRWSGAPLQSFPFSSGGSTTNLDDGVVRILAFNGNAVYVSFQARNDDNTGTQDYQDAVLFAFTEGTGNGAHIVSITPDWTTPQPAVAGQPHDAAAPVPVDRGFIDWFSTTDPTNTPWSLNQEPAAPAPAIPSWLHDVATWRNSPGAKWAITFWIDLSDPSLHITTAMKMFWGMQIHNSMGTVLFGSNPLNTSPHPLPQNDTIVPDLPSGWTQMATVGTVCTPGVTVNAADIGIWDGTSLSSTICTGGACTGTNTFQVTARNLIGQNVADFAVRVRWKFAEWGSTVPDPTRGNWQEIPRAVPQSSQMISVTAQTLATNGWSWTYTCTGDATIDYTCKLGTDPYCPKLLNANDTASLLWAEIVQPSPQLYSITTPSALRSMSYATLSTLSTPATISLKGLETGTGPQQERDVYLFTDDRNLPPPGDQPIKLNGAALTYARSYAEHPAMPLPRDRHAGEKPSGCKPDQPPPPPNPPSEQGKLGAHSIKQKPSLRVASPRVIKSEDPIAQLLEKPVQLAPGLDTSSILSMSRAQLVDAVWPTQTVRVYYDTGRTITTHGQTSKVLAPMIPFGYHFSHDGALYGFSSKLEGAGGTKLEPLSEHWSKIRMKDGDSVRVVQNVEAKEAPRTSTPPASSSPPAQGTPSCPSCPTPGPVCNCTVPGRLRGGAGALAGVLGITGALFARRRRRLASLGRSRR